MMFDSALHPNTRAMLDALMRQSQRPQSAGASIDDLVPALPPHPDSAEVAGRVIVLDASGGETRLRHVGHALEPVLPNPLPGLFVQMWQHPDRPLIDATTAAVLARWAPAVIRGHAQSGTHVRVEFEMVLAPLDPPSRRAEIRRGASQGVRLIGLMQTLGAEGFLRGRPVSMLALTAIFAPRLAVTRPHLQLVTRPD